MIRVNNNKGGEFVKKANKPVVNVNGNNNNVEVNININMPSSKLTATVIVMIVAILVVSYCCPELRTDFVRWIISTVIGG